MSKSLDTLIEKIAVVSSSDEYFTVSARVPKSVYELLQKEKEILGVSLSKLCAAKLAVKAQFLDDLLERLVNE